MDRSSKKVGDGFTLIELVVTVGIVAILSIFVILALNPSELRAESRDARRVSDLGTINKAVSIYYSDAINSPSTLFMGNVSTTYISIPDPSATTTAGDQCQGLNLPSLATGWIYHCAASSSYQSVTGTGWIPINFNAFSGGNFIPQIPVDPTNQTSTGLYYAYTTDGNSYEITSIMESTKYRSKFSVAPTAPTYPGINAVGTSFSLSGIFNPNGLLGYWSLDEGKGSSTIDQTGNGNNGTWSGTASGVTNTYYTTGKVGSYAGVFSSNGTTKVSLTSPASLTGSASKSISAWFNPSTLRSNEQDVVEFGSDTTNGTFGIALNSSNDIFAHMGGSGDFSSTVVPTVGSWYNVIVTYNGSLVTLYINGQLSTSSTETLSTGSNNFYFGQHLTSAANYFVGSIDDVRVYNRALSAAEAQELYNAQK